LKARKNMHSPDTAEQRRLAAVHALQWLETARNEDFQRICRLAAAYFKVPTVLISLVEDERQWFPARIGFDQGETPINQSFCAFTIRQEGVMQVCDARQDPRFQATALVTAAGGIRFYAGATLRTREGCNIGSLCIIDKFPNQLSPHDSEVLQDMAEMVMAQIEQRQMLDTRDPVSGLPNLRQFLTDTRGAEFDPQAPVRVMMLIEAVDNQWQPDDGIDDNFTALRSGARRVSDKLAHILAGVAHLYQLSEQQFCLMLTCAPQRQLELTRALVEMITQPFPTRDFPLAPCTRIGVACCLDGSQSVGNLLRKAIHAANAAEQARTRWYAYDESRAHIHRRAYSLVNDFTSAMEGGGMYLEFQPRFNLQDGRQLGAEALLRWRHQQYGPVSPAEFIPLIERAGQITSVTRWVIDRSLAAVAQWRQGDSKVSINLSALDFQGMDIAHTLSRACALYKVPAARVEVEITEGEWIREAPNVIAQLTRIRALGVDVAIDDFGTGYSNFAYLRDIPANVLKLDQSIITDLENKPRNRVIARSVLQLARELGYRTVAEGIETFKSLSLVKSYGCHEAQGYFLSRPLPAERMREHVGDSTDFPLIACG
jgi:EAL domain-containing protein (putative c-di-GMP-specific phosphodiesterase class I)/GGDEF domain-containing protein